MERIATFSRQYDIAKKLMILFGMTAGAAFGLAAYFAPSVASRNSMLLSAATSFSPVPVTVLAILPMVMRLKGIEKAGDKEMAEKEGDGLIEAWGRLSLLRWGIVAVGCLNGLREIARTYSLA
jgi:Anthrone oxygenase